jgi:hypothetical protein
LAQIADPGPALPSGLLQARQVLSGLSVRLRVDGDLQRRLSAGADLVPRHQQLSAQVGGQAVGSALGPYCSSEHTLELAEARFELVGRGRQVGIVEAGEQVRPPASRKRNYVVDEGGRGRAEAHSRRLVLQGGQIVPELRLGLGCVPRTVWARGVGAQVVSDVSKELDVSLDPAGGAGALPGQAQRLLELVEPGRGYPLALRVFFFRALSRLARTCSRRW